MTKRPPSYAQLTHDVVQQSPAPLTLDEIMARVSATRPITTKNPKSTIRGAIGSSYMIVSTGDGRYAWKPRIINGSILRHTLSTAELVQEVLHWDDDVWDALWPTFFAREQYDDRGPIFVTLPDGDVVEFGLVHFYDALWGTRATPAFWTWLANLQPQPGDHLLFTIHDGDARRYGVIYQRRADRDEAAVAARNRELTALAEALAQKRHGADHWRISTTALVTGFYKQPIPPDPLGEIWIADPWGNKYFEDTPTQHRSDQEQDALASALFARPAQMYDPLGSPPLPKAYDPAWGWRTARPSLKARQGSVTSYTFRVSHRAYPDVLRDLELAEDQTLEDLHLEIQSSYMWDDDHLYSFFLSGEPWDSSSEIGSPWSEASLHTHQVQLGQLDLQEGQTICYLFDYGDNHEFDVVVLRVNSLGPKGKYPKTLTYHGNVPPQYGNWEEWDEDDEDW